VPHPSHRPLLAAGVLSLLTGAAAGCDAGSAADQPVDAPPIYVTDVAAATSVADGVLVYGPLGSGAVIANSPLKVHFDRLLQPGTATRQALCVQPLQKTVLSSADCTAGVFFEVAYDPVRREATYRQSPANPPLAAGPTYRLTTYIPSDANPGGFRAFEGTPIGKVFSADFTVSGDPPPSTYDTISTADHFCTGPAPTCLDDCAPACIKKFGIVDPQEQPCEIACLAACPRGVTDILGRNGCAVATCHGPTADAGDVEPMGLVMSSNAALHATAIGRVAHETQDGEQARVPNESPPRFGRAMPILDPGSPGNSYLIYKLLANYQTKPEVPFLDTPPGGEAPEVRRVRTTLIAGMPMPPSGSEAYLRDGEIEWLAEWLLQGAPTKTCP
jgi:hypothetical protein